MVPVTLNNNHLIKAYSPIDRHMFTLLKVLGSGRFATVFLAEIKYDGRLASIKVINKAILHENGSPEQIRNEVNTHKILRNC